MSNCLLSPLQAPTWLRQQSIGATTEGKFTPGKNGFINIPDTASEEAARQAEIQYDHTRTTGNPSSESASSPKTLAHA